MEKEALEFIYNLQRIYLEQCDVEKILSAIDENTTWIGSGKHEFCRCFSDAVRALLKEKEEYQGGFTITDHWYDTVPLQGDSCIVYGEIWATPKDVTANVAELHYRITAVCVKTAQGMKLIHLHMSRPDDNQESGKYFVKRRPQTESQGLHHRYKQTIGEMPQNALPEHNKEMEILTQNIPCGLHRCRNDIELTLLSMSDSFVQMFGYTRQEIYDLFQDRFIYMIYEEDRAAFVKTMREQRSYSRTIEFEYRVRCKDNTLVWVLDHCRLMTEEDGSQSFFCVMMDITQRKEEQTKIREALERYQIIFEQNDDIIFEWDMEKDTLYFSPNWQKKFGYMPICEEVSHRLPLSTNIHPDDMFSVLNLMRDATAGVPYSEVELRICKYPSEYLWCRVRVTTKLNGAGNPIRSVGVIVDIVAEKSRSKALLDAAQYDTLTQLYNKNATKSKVDSILLQSTRDETHTLLIIDIDNFQTINDRFGHEYGDTVLNGMAQMLKKLFRVTDVIGRIGGDEFLVFMANVSSQELVCAKAREIANIFRDIPAEVAAEFTCSVGIASYSRDALDYAGLCNCADIALSSVKNSGKARYAFYDKNMRSNTPYFLTRLPTINESYFHASLHEDLVQYAFQLLYNATDTQKAVNRLLETVGRAYDVSRVYIVEASENGRFCSNTFEWCNEGIEPEKENLQHLSLETNLAGLFALYDDNGIFYCQEVQTLSDPSLRAIFLEQGVISVLQCYILDTGDFRGYIGFDECRKNRYWSKEQMQALTMISNLLSTFLTKQRYKEQLSVLKKQQNQTRYIAGFGKS